MVVRSVFLGENAGWDFLFCHLALTTVSAEFLFFSQVEIFLVFGMRSDFPFKPGYFGYYVVRLWILVKFSVAGVVVFVLFCGHCPGGEGKRCLATVLLPGVLTGPDSPLAFLGTESERLLFLLCGPGVQGLIRPTASILAGRGRGQTALCMASNVIVRGQLIAAGRLSIRPPATPHNREGRGALFSSGGGGSGGSPLSLCWQLCLWC